MWVRDEDQPFDARMAEWFPGKRIEPSSPYDLSYNCVAWAIGDNQHYWDDLSGKWLGKRGSGIEHLEGVFAELGFVHCDNEEYDPAFDKVALFALDGEWTHACRLCDDGRWWSKLGRWEDVKHALRDVEGDSYGRVHSIMKRPVLPGLH